MRPSTKSSRRLLARRRFADFPVRDPPEPQLAGVGAHDHERRALPLADVGDVRLRRARLRLGVRVEDADLVAGVLELERQRGVGEAEREAVRALVEVDAAVVALSAAVPDRQHAAGLVRERVLCVRPELLPHRGRDHHQTVRSIASSTSSAAQNAAERYFQPPSARTQTTTPSSSSSPSFCPTCTTPPDETPAKIASPSRSARTPRTDSAFETSSFRSSFETSRIGGT